MASSNYPIISRTLLVFIAVLSFSSSFGQSYELDVKSLQEYTAFLDGVSVGITESNATDSFSLPDTFNFFGKQEYPLSEVYVNLKSTSLRIVNGTTGDFLFVYGLYPILETPKFINGVSEITWKKELDWLKIQFSNVSIEGLSSSKLFNCQFWLNLDDYEVQIHFGSNNTEVMGQTIVGIDLRNSNLNYIMGFRALGDPKSPTTGSTTTTFLDNPPDSGMVYTFQPKNLSIDSESLTKNTIQAYPNPADNNIYFEGIDQGFVTITDALGKVVIASDYVNVIDVTNLQPGMYNVRIETENQLATSRFIKL